MKTSRATAMFGAEAGRVIDEFGGVNDDNRELLQEIVDGCDCVPDLYAKLEETMATTQAMVDTAVLSAM